jgi:hypothetical protein
MEIIISPRPKMDSMAHWPQSCLKASPSTGSTRYVLMARSPPISSLMCVIRASSGR